MGVFVFAPLLASTLGNPPECVGCEANSGIDCTAPDIDIIATPAVGTTVLANEAFVDCANIRSVTVKSGVTAFENRAFDRTGITSVFIPKSVTTIGDYAFGGALNLTTVTFEANSELTSIGAYAFATEHAENPKLTSIQIPKSVTTIGFAAFSGSSENARRTRRSEEKVVLSITFEPGSQLTKIEDSTFFGNSCLQTIQVPNLVTTIGMYAFSDTTLLTSVTFEPGSQLGLIENDAFYDSSLMSIEIPANVQTIGTEAFRSTADLATVTFADDSVLTTIGNNAFTGCNSLNLVKIPTTVTTIGTGAFQGVSVPARRGRRLLQDGPGAGSLDSVSIPEGATVGAGAFENQACPEDSYTAGTTMCECDTTDDSCFLEGGAPTAAPTAAPPPPLSPVAITGIALGSVVGAAAIGYISYGAYTASGSGSGSGSTESGQKLLTSTYL